MNKAKTIYVNARFLTQAPTGVQRYAFEVCVQMKKIRPDIVFVAPKNIYSKDQAGQLDAVCIGWGSGYFWEQIELPLYLKRKGSPPLLSPANTGPLFYRNQFLTLHDLAFIHYPGHFSGLFVRVYHFLIPRLLQRIRHVFTVSQTVSREIAHHFPNTRGRITVTYNGLSVAFQNYFQKSKSIQKEKQILMVGSFNLRKNYAVAIEGFLSAKLNHYTLNIIGHHQNIFTSDTLPGSDKVKFWESVSDEALFEAYEKAEIFISLSVYEGFGIPVLEAIAAGCKVVCSDIPVYQELFSGNVYFCPSNDAAELADCLKKVISDSNMKPNSVSLDPKFDYKQSAMQIIDTIEQNS
ncbi:MAG: glycosyltransferase family 4 protein [Chitinophagaceae bacterium]|nr:glycosyltransferase family 4 protein [Chitinophagaceae bacterium]